MPLISSRSRETVKDIVAIIRVVAKKDKRR